MHLFLSLLHFYFKIKQVNLKNRTGAFTIWVKRLITYSLTSLLENRRNMFFVVWYYLSNSSIDVKNVIFVLEKDIK